MTTERNDTSAPLDLDAIEALCNAATDGPWCWARTSDQDFSAAVGSNVFAADDTECISPLSGDVSDRLDDYRVGDGIAEMSHQKSQFDAAFIAAARSLVPQLVAEVRALREANTVLDNALSTLRDHLPIAVGDADFADSAQEQCDASLLAARDLVNAARRGAA